MELSGRRRDRLFIIEMPKVVHPAVKFFHVTTNFVSELPAQHGRRSLLHSLCLQLEEFFEP
jgi:hypothetical protein